MTTMIREFRHGDFRSAVWSVETEGFVTVTHEARTDGRPATRTEYGPFETYRKGITAQASETASQEHYRAVSLYLDAAALVSA